MAAPFYDPTRDPPRLTGRALPPPRGRTATLLLAITGLLLVKHLARLLAYVVGYRHRATISFDGGRALKVKRVATLLGKTVRTSEERFGPGAVVSVAIEERRRGWLLLLGAGALAGGIAVGIALVAEGIRGGYLPYLLAGPVIIALGAVVDWLADFGLRRGGRSRYVTVRALEGAKGEARALRTVRVGLDAGQESSRFVEWCTQGAPPAMTAVEQAMSRETQLMEERTDG